METIETQTWIIIAAVVALGLAVIGAWLYTRRRQSHKLQERFGLEYERTVSDLGSRTKGEYPLSPAVEIITRSTESL